MGFFVTLIFELLTHFANHFTGYFFPFFFAVQGIEKGRKRKNAFRIPLTDTEKRFSDGKKGKFKERNEIPSEMKMPPRQDDVTKVRYFRSADFVPPETNVYRLTLICFPFFLSSSFLLLFIV